MRQAFHTLEIKTPRKGLIDITSPLENWIADTGIADGLLTLWCRHTSASLVVQENADPTVLRDIEAYFDELVPESRHYQHHYEGVDDMPAHIRSLLTNVQLSLPVRYGRTVLGTWQGLYLFEHRRRPHHRQIALNLIGD